MRGSAVWMTDVRGRPRIADVRRETAGTGRKSGVFCCVREIRRRATNRLMTAGRAGDDVAARPGRKGQMAGPLRVETGGERGANVGVIGGSAL